MKVAVATTVATANSLVQRLSDNLMKECRTKLIEVRRDLLNRVWTARMEFAGIDKSGGDEADQTMGVLAEHDYLVTQQRLQALLIEVDFALARIEAGTYGICEETEELIEFDRLRAIPWTRVSLEGAELRDATNRKLAR